MPKTIEQYREFLQSLTLPLVTEDQIRSGIARFTKENTHASGIKCGVMETAQHVRKFLKEDEDATTG